MDDPPAWAEPWPFWKFGLKQRDLNTTLHDRFNTITTPIQDSEAFHHDVFELSSKASDLAEFERMMEDRKALRLKELNGMLDDASFEIIGNPRLIGTEQWGLAIQLFRTKSLDSLVRYFSSYLPSDHPWHPDSDTCSNSTTGDADLLNGPHADYDGPILFDEPDEDDTIYTHEHSEAFSRCDTAVDHPTRSNSLRSQDSGVSVNERVQRKADHQPHPTSQAMSVPESEPDHIAASLQSSVPTLHHDEAPSPSDDPETPSSASDILQTEDQAHRKDGLMTTTIVDEEELEGYLSISHTHLQNMDTTTDSDTPTPQADHAAHAASATPLFDTKPSPLRSRNLSSCRSYPHHGHHDHHNHHQPHRNHRAVARQLRQREGSLDCDGKAEGGPVGRADRRRETSPDHIRSRARARRKRFGA